MTVGEAIVYAKKTLRLRVFDFAHATGTSTRNVDRWLADEAKPDERRARALLAYIASFDRNLAITIAPSFDLATPWVPPPLPAPPPEPPAPAPPPVLAAPPSAPPRPVPTVDEIASTLLVVAEQLQVGPRELRTAVHRVITTWAARDWTLPDIAAALEALESRVVANTPAKRS